MSKLEAIKAGIQQSASGVGQRFQGLGQGTSRRDQLLAALCVPFFIVAIMGAAEVLNEVILDFLPDDLGPLAFVTFLLGTGLVIAVMVTTVAWVKTGGFGLFAH